MRTTSTFLAAALCALAAACGGKSAPASTGPGNTGGAGDPAGDDAAKLGWDEKKADQFRAYRSGGSTGFGSETGLMTGASISGGATSMMSPPIRT